MPLVIRRATFEDTPTLVEFSCRLAQETEGKTLDQEKVRVGVGAGLADPAKAVYFVAEEDGAVLGQMMYTTEWSDWSNGWLWWIQSVYVHSDARRRGIYRALYDHILQLARQDPTVIGLRLYVERDNHVAQETYRRLGMEQTSYLVFERCPL